MLFFLDRRARVWYNKESRMGGTMGDLRRNGCAFQNEYALSHLNPFFLSSV